MSTLNNLFREVWSLLARSVEMVLPRRCPICGVALQRGHYYLCTSCMLDAPLTYSWLDGENIMAQRVRVLRPDIEMAASLIFYIRGGLWRESIHRLKYDGEWHYAIRYGEWLGSILREAPLYKGVDTVVAIPLHPLRQFRRGYNQSNYIAQGVAKTMGVEHLRGVVRRKRHNPPQAHTLRDDRWRNVEDLFEVTDKEALRGRNILLLDDVFTTGATIMSCAEAILDSRPKCRLWIATLALANNQSDMSQQ